jgi:hypothetical protein
MSLVEVGDDGKDGPADGYQREQNAGDENMVEFHGDSSAAAKRW